MSTPRLAALAGGLAGLVIAFSPQLEQAAAATLTAHMVQHLLVTLVAAPLLVLGAPALWTIVHRPGWLRPPPPLLALAAATAVTWGWHLPAAYGAAVTSLPVHMALHASLLAGGLALWSAIARPGGRGQGILLVFGAATGHAGLASLLLFAPAPLYGHTLDDQRLAAVVMATPAKLVYGIALVVLVLTWLSGLERRTAAREAHRAA